MKILIIEDERRTADLLIRLIRQYDNTYTVLGVIDSVEKGVEWFTNKTEDPDLLLLDILLTDGISFELFEKVNIELPVIFITAYNEFAINAFRLNSIDYLLKPVDFTDLKKAFDKFRKMKETYFKVGLQEYNIKLKPDYLAHKRRFLVKSGTSYRYIRTDEIGYFLADEGLIFAYLLAGGRSIVETSLTELGMELDPEQFYQLNRKTIINIAAIQKISNYFNRRVIVHLKPDNLEAIVSRERVQNFKGWLDK
jgi:two-component system, LytTR family, response regulator LytT